MTDAQMGKPRVAGGFPGDPATLHLAMSELRALGIAAFGKLFGSEAPAEVPCHALNAWLSFDLRDIAAVDRNARKMNDSMPFVPCDPPMQFTRGVFAEGATGKSKGAKTLPERIWRRLLYAPSRMERALAFRLVRFRRRLLDLGAGSGGLTEAVPDAGVFFEEVAATAFSTPQFRRSLLRIARNVLRGRVLFGLEGPPVEPPAVQTCLALVAAVGRPPGLNPAAWERFRFGASGMVEKPGWARFWDLWILDSARRRDGFALMERCEELAASFQEADGSLDDISGHEALAPNWWSSAPNPRPGWSELAQATQGAGGDAIQKPARYDIIGVFIQSDRDSNPGDNGGRSPPSCQKN